MNQVEINASIRDNATGEVLVQRDLCNANEDWEPNPFWWKDGNAGCDCNRKLFFYRGMKGVELDDEDTPCGHGAFSVNLATLDGETFYREFED